MSEDEPDHENFSSSEIGREQYSRSGSCTPPWLQERDIYIPPTKITNPTREECYELVEALKERIDADNLDAEYDSMNNELHWFEIFPDIPPNDLTGIIVECVKKVTMIPFIKSNLPWKYFIILREFWIHSDKCEIILYDIAMERFEGLIDAKIYNFIIERLHDVDLPDYVINQFLEIKDKQDVIIPLIDNSIGSYGEKWINILKRLQNIYDFEFTSTYSRYFDYEKMHDKNDLIRLINSCVIYSSRTTNLDHSPTTNLDHSSSRIDEETIVDFFCKNYNNIVLDDYFFNEYLRILFNFFEYLRMDQIVKIWTFLKEKNANIFRILGNLCGTFSPIAIEYILNEISHEQIDEWYKLWYCDDLDNSISKCFINATIKKWPQSYDKVFVEVIRFNHDNLRNIKRLFPDVTLNEVIEIIIRYNVVEQALH